MQMISIEKKVHGIARIMYYLAGLSIILMMLFTTLDVFLRFCVTLYGKFGWAFLASWRPVTGTYDLVAMCGAIAASCAMAHTTLESGHVAVSLVVRLLSKKKQLLVRLFTDFASLFLFGILAWRSMVYADNLREYGEVTMTMQLPYHPFVYILAASSLAVALLYLIDILKTMKKVVSL